MTSSKRKLLSDCMDSAVYFLSAEWLLRWRPNGGTTVFVRAVLVSAIFFVIAAIISLLFYWNFTRAAFPSELRSAALRMLPYAGAVFAFAYTALYARFASQWSYLANLYNQIMAVQTTQRDHDREAMTDWKVGFIQDASELHLAGKPMFAEVISNMLEDEAVQLAFKASVTRGAEKLEELEGQLNQALQKP